MSYLIKLDNIVKTYQLEKNTISVLNGVNLQIARGEMIAIGGVSGSGKSTLMNIIGFLDSCTSGKYYFNGEDVSCLTPSELADMRNRKIGFVFQSFFLLTRMSALRNVMLPLFYRGLPFKQAKEKSMAMLEKINIGHLAHHKPNQLSGGQQQRVAIARALVGEPDVILADEPTGALDSQTGNAVMDLFTDLNRKEGKTIVIITHDSDISRRCRRIVTMKDGRIME